MRPEDPTRPMGEGGLASLLGLGVLALALLSACAGENLFTGPVGGGELSGPQVDITAPQADLTLAVGDSVRVTANLTAPDGLTEVSYTGKLDSGAEAFTAVTVNLPSPQDTTVSHYLKRSGTTPGNAKIVVTATDALGATGADTVTIILGG